MNVLYVHGFGSHFDPSKGKIKILSDELPKHFCDFDLPVKVLGDSIDYCNEDPVKKMVAFAMRNHVDLIIGTSMGAWTASHVGETLGVPWVAINPACTPRKSLARHLDRSGEIDFSGRIINLAESHIDSVYSESMKRDGLFIFDKDDELFDYKETLKTVGDDVSYVVFEGGSHRFEHMAEAVPHIASYWNRVSCTGDKDS
uniref:YqiA/YcfP family alpha/beta fold hydrolase n=1 Tax=uncultured Halomonas sp. TaxID=173971 RepID=UPI0026324CA3|nr:YqiA/YcfP family alpha/beta fold hydrolase [uncultured Halomonas sp.]